MKIRGEILLTLKMPAAFITIIIFAQVVLQVAAIEPAVMVTNYQVSPDVLMPKDIGTLTVTIKNSAEHTSTGHHLKIQ